MAEIVLLKQLLHQKLIAVYGNELSFCDLFCIRFLVHCISSNYNSVPGTCVFAGC